jgi:hypothetical protein
LNPCFALCGSYANQGDRGNRHALVNQKLGSPGLLAAHMPLYLGAIIPVLTISSQQRLLEEYPPIDLAQVGQIVEETGDVERRVDVGKNESVPDSQVRLFRVMLKYFNGDEVNAFIHWMKHPSGSDGAETTEEEVVIQKYVAAYKATHPDFQKLGDWVIGGKAREQLIRGGRLYGSGWQSNSLSP